MLEFYLRSTRGIARARSSPVGPYLDGFATALREFDYCREVGAWCITYAVHLGLWAAAEDVQIGALDEGGCACIPGAPATVPLPWSPRLPPCSRPCAHRG